MNTNEIISRMTETITQCVVKHGACGQLYGSWSKLYSDESREQLAESLRNNGIERIKIYDYAELYVMENMDSDEKEKIIVAGKKITPTLFEEVAANVVLSRREKVTKESLADFLVEVLNEVVSTIKEKDDKTYELDEN